jgi:hypothetical protein
MSEAKIIIPVDCLSASRLSELASELCGTFGGMTTTEGNGSWVDNSGDLINEPVTVYYVALTDEAISREGANEILRTLASWIAKHGDQDCVYIRDFDGEVELVKPYDWRVEVTGD